MLKLGIIKSQVGHSLSEVMQTAALQHLKIKGEYKEYGFSPENLQEEFNKLKSCGIKGLNVTIPHKVRIIPFLDELTDTAKLIGAVNTITFDEKGKSIGDNTDLLGFWEGIPENIRKEIEGKNTAILGCGGAANAVAIAFLKNKVKKIKVYGRNKEKLTEFKSFLESKKEILKSETEIFTDLIGNINLSDVFILTNTTPIGMFPNVGESILSMQDLEKLLKDAFVYDIIYKPEETKLLKDAKLLNLQTLNGVEMLVRQGAASLNIWLGKKVAPIEIMRIAVIESLKTKVSG